MKKVLQWSRKCLIKTVMTILKGLVLKMQKSKIGN